MAMCSFSRVLRSDHFVFKMQFFVVVVWSPFIFCDWFLCSSLRSFCLTISPKLHGTHFFSPAELNLNAIFRSRSVRWIFIDLIGMVYSICVFGWKKNKFVARTQKTAAMAFDIIRLISLQQHTHTHTANDIHTDNWCAADILLCVRLLNHSTCYFYTCITWYWRTHVKQLAKYFRR